MSEYNFSAIEKKWQRHWLENKTFKTDSARGGGVGLESLVFEPVALPLLLDG